MSDALGRGQFHECQKFAFNYALTVPYLHIKVDKSKRSDLKKVEKAYVKFVEQRLDENRSLHRTDETDRKVDEIIDAVQQFETCGNISKSKFTTM